MVCDWELAEARKKESLDRAKVRGEQPPAELLAEERGLHSSIEADVMNLLQGKTYRELEVLQSEIASQMLSGTAKVVEYWEAIIKRLHIYKATVHSATIKSVRIVAILISSFMFDIFHDRPVSKKFMLRCYTSIWNILNNLWEVKEMWRGKKTWKGITEA